MELLTAPREAEMGKRNKKNKAPNAPAAMPPFTHVSVLVPKELTAEDLAKMAFAAGCGIRIQVSKNRMDFVMNRRSPAAETHSGDCTIYATLVNGRPEDGICICGYGRRLMTRSGDWSQMYSDERKKQMEFDEVAKRCDNGRKKK